MQHTAAHATLVDLLRTQAARQPDKPAYIFLQDGELDEVRMTYQELDRRAQAIAALLQQQGTAGERVLLLYPPGLDYIAAFFGCLYAGAVAVPAYPPNPARLDRTLPRLQAIVQDARPAVALTTAQIASIAGMLGAQVPEFGAVQWFATDTISDDQAAEWRAPAAESDTLAFLQYTSGSTSTPKGVMLTHGNLLHNSEVIHQGFGTEADSRGVFWLPFYHDMGLIGGLLQPIYCGGTSMLLSPVDFLQRPLRWLQAISRFKATISGGPNFAYDLCSRKVTPEQLQQLDLSSWRVAFNGAEPIRAETLDRFVATFGPCGFRREAFYPCYGLAEATLLVTGVSPEAAPLVGDFDAAALERSRAVPAAGDPRARSLVGSGQPRQTMAIVQPDTLTECAPGQIGEVWVSSGSIAQGYWNRPEESQRSFGARLADRPGAGPFLRTGDLGFVHGGELFVAGRIKDLIIIRGRNHYPQDIELTVERSHPALRPGCGAAVSVEVAGEERLVVVQEVERQHRTVDVEAVADAVRQAVAQAHELSVYAVVLLRHGSIPKTSSGKIQRHACKAGFLDGSLDTVGASQREEQVEAAPAADLTRAALLEAAPEARRTLLAGYLQAQIARVLRIEAAQVGLDRPVSAVGLDSLMAVELQHTIETDLGVVVSMVSFLQDHTVALLADELLGQLEDGATSHLAATGEETGAHPLSPGQRALWFLHQLAPESAAYNIASSVRIHGALDGAAMRRSIQRLVDRHPALRTTFAMENGEAVQHVHKEAELAFEQLDATRWTASELERWLQAASQLPFDLGRGPLLRVALLARAADEHILLVTVHHSVSDLWSLAVLVRELSAIYPAERAGTAAELPTPALRYTDYVRWQSELLAGPEGERQWQFWKQQLAGAPSVLNLPTDRPRPPIQTYNGAVQAFTLDAALTGRLKALAEASGATLYTVLLAAFEVLLYRYSGQHDFVIGTPTAGRSRAEFTDLVGYFVNSVALRANLAGAPSFGQLVERVRQNSLSAFAHQDYPLVTLIERMQLGRDLSRSPLFQVMFALQKASVRDEVDLTAFALGDGGSRITVGGQEWEALPLAQRVAQFDLSLAMGETADGLAATLEYNTDLFDGTTAQRMAHYFQTLLEAIVADPAQRIDDLPLLNADEQRRVLVSWNATAAPVPAVPSVHALFEAQARRTPAATAVIYGDDRLTYRELDSRADALAARLRRLGVGPETLVGICADRSVEMMIGVMGILKAGGAYLPLDPTYPAERLAFILNQTRTPVLLTQEALRDGLPAHNATVICLDCEGDSAPAVADLPRTPVLPDNLACVIFTSGSTGQPKGVELTHGGIINLIESFVRSYEPGTSDRMLPLTSLASASFVGEIFPPLCAGGGLVLPNNVEVLDFEALCALITRQHVTMLSAVPSLIARLNSRADALPELRLLLSGGEALALGDIDKLLDTTTISNGYGLTETTVCSTFYHVNPRQADTGGYVSIGKPLINTEIYILDERMHPAPIGVPGELYVGGAGLARGYLDDPALTAERFVPNPFGERLETRDVRLVGSEAQASSLKPQASRLYRTGDRARWLPDGMIEFVGRIDHQVKIRGFRIELGEIETLLCSHESIREAVVVAREDAPGDKRLVAYAVPSTEAAVAELREFLRERLPGYMIPAAFVLLETLPLTPNGKVDLRALPLPSTDRTESATYLAPRSEFEHTIAAAWQSALKVEKVGIHDNFFDLGGHSLLMVQVHTELREVYGQLTLIDMFRHPTVSALAAHLSAARPAESALVEVQDRVQKQKAFRDRRKELLKNRASS
ncbi:MAG TPA: amino acid adenylation domain-containing protein [Roseiflexaceae bacterium]|nr:amino acid adenylation domain-containing protein [Roseiflexaceae bacterium]